ncbi:hypothetical protein [Alkalihalobacillus trypoxylicola]|uniref:YesK-like protein n=1 Tax=Alkalihalobacillus trypoxylicola TaxID=519424 RepID=A0A162DNP4_9BACI|nr:hypothetical protein [Alkalihalobacillus trypoxylicola]KYG30411.1 hypothetical protein AZF04_19805 [Alkalihalobacillus trypoxylicola]
MHAFIILIMGVLLLGLLFTVLHIRLKEHSLVKYASFLLFASPIVGIHLFMLGLSMQMMFVMMISFIVPIVLLFISIALFFLNRQRNPFGRGWDISHE